MSGTEAAAFLLLAAGAWYAIQAAQHPAQAIAPASQQTFFPDYGAAYGPPKPAAVAAGKSAVPAALLGAGLATGATMYPDYGADYGPANPAVAAAGANAVPGAILGAGLMTFTPSLSGVSTVQNKPGYLKPVSVWALAYKVIHNYHFNVSEQMATAIAIIESGDLNNPNNGCNPNATRYEAGLGVSSTGLMQVLSSTANWLYSSMGYTGKHPADLFDPEAAMYFGCAYLDYLSKYKGQARGADFIVQSYNAGPGNPSTGYLAKYNKALSWVAQNLG